MRVARSKRVSLTFPWGLLYLGLGLWMAYSGYRRLGVLPMQDTMLAFDSFYWFYNSLYQGLGVPQLLVQSCFGTPSGFYPLTFLSPSSFLSMATGLAFGVQDVFILFTSAVMLDQYIYVGGIALVCSRLSLSRRATFLACLGAALTVVVHYQYSFNFRAFAYFPVCLWAIQGLVEKKTLNSLMVFFVFFAAGAMGTVQYVVPMSLLLFSLFAVIVWTGPKPTWRRLRLSGFSALLWGLFAAGLATAYFAQVFQAVTNVVSMSAGRDPVTMVPTFESFARVAAGIDFKDLIQQYLLGKDCFSNSNWYVGLVPLVCIITAASSCRSRPFWACLGCVGLMVAFACAGVLSLFVYNLPALNFFRHPGWFLSATKPFLLLAFAIALDHLAQGQKMAVRTAFKVCLGVILTLLCLDLLGVQSMREDIIKMMMARNCVLNPVLITVYCLLVWAALRALRSGASAGLFLPLALVFGVEMFSVQWCVFKGESALPAFEPGQRALLLTMPVRIDTMNRTDVQNLRQLELKSLLVRTQSNYPIQRELMGLSPCLKRERYEIIDVNAYQAMNLVDEGADPSWLGFAASCNQDKVRFAVGPRYYGSIRELTRQLRQKANKHVDWIEDTGSFDDWPGFVDFPPASRAYVEDFGGTGILELVRYDAASNSIVHSDLLTPQATDKALLRFGSKRLFHWQVLSIDGSGHSGIIFSLADMPNRFFLSSWEGGKLSEPHLAFDFHLSHSRGDRAKDNPLAVDQFDFRRREDGRLNFFNYDVQRDNALYMTDTLTSERIYVAPLRHDHPVQRRYLDLNRDGLEDVALIYDSHILFALAKPSGGYDTVLYSGGTTENFFNICFADVDGDGLKDIVAIKGSEIWVSLNRGNGFDAPNIWYSSVPPGVRLLHGEAPEGGPGVFCLLAGSTASFLYPDGKRFVLRSQTRCPGLESLASGEIMVRPDKQGGFLVISEGPGAVDVFRLFDQGMHSIQTFHESVPLPPLGHDGASVTGISFTPNRIEFSWNRPTSSTPWVIVSLAYNPYWAVTVNGQPGELHQANGGLIALRVPAGPGHAVMEYKHPARQVAVNAYAFFSLLAGIVLGSLTLWTFVNLIRNGDVLFSKFRNGSEEYEEK